MLNFDYHIGTEIFFGRGQLAKLPAAIRRHTDKVLLCYGGGSVKRTGLLAQVQSALCEAGISYVELAGVEPNPRTTTVDRGAALCRQHGLGGVLAVGGGSTIDCAKVVAAARFYSGPAWDLIERKAPVTQVLPVFSVLTLSATGSEMDDVAVISNWQTSEKRSIAHPAMRPVASVLDPAYTFTVPAGCTAVAQIDGGRHGGHYEPHAGDVFFALPDRLFAGQNGRGHFENVHPLWAHCPAHAGRLHRPGQPDVGLQPRHQRHHCPGQRVPVERAHHGAPAFGLL